MRTPAHPRTSLRLQRLGTLCEACCALGVRPTRLLDVDRPLRPRDGESDLQISGPSLRQSIGNAALPRMAG